MIASIFWRFAGLSLLAFGGVNAMLAEIQRVVVQQLHWMDNAEFSHLFAIAQAAPGPNLLILSLLGWHVAGLGGAIASTAGFCVPSGALVFFVLKAWDRFRHATWRRIVEVAVAPIAVGLVVASGLQMSMQAATSEGPTGRILAWATIAAVIVIQMRWRLHPLWLIGLGAVAGALGAFSA